MAVTLTPNASAPTRGYGILESFLAQRRAATANRLLPASVGRGSLLDVGCGSWPLFLEQAAAAERVGLDRQVPTAGAIRNGVRLIHHNIDGHHRLPFNDATFHAVTMLAVLEHISAGSRDRLLGEIRRVLRPGGRLVVTTPAGWTDPLLWLLARLRLVSPVEIDDHHVTYNRCELRRVLELAGFAPDRVATGTFELGMNLWATADC